MGKMCVLLGQRVSPAPRAQSQNPTHLERKYRHLKYAARDRDKILINWLFA